MNKLLYHLSNWTHAMHVFHYGQPFELPSPFVSRHNEALNGIFAMLAPAARWVSIYVFYLYQKRRTGAKSFRSHLKQCGMLPPPTPARKPDDRVQCGICGQWYHR